MKNIIAYSMEKLYKEFEVACRLAFFEFRNERQLMEVAKRVVAEHIGAFCSDMDRILYEDISRGKKYTIQRHDSRQLVTTAGVVNFTHTFFKKREDGNYHYLLDEWMGLDAHERLSEKAETAVVTEAINTSYAHASKVLGEDARISKMVIINKIRALREELPFQRSRPIG